jgi:hypothetical protein
MSWLVYDSYQVCIDCRLEVPDEIQALVILHDDN